MFKKIRKSLEDYKIKRWTNQMIYYHSNIPKLLERHKELKQYVPRLVELSNFKNKLLYDFKERKGTPEIQFAILMLRRNQDFFEGIILSLWHNNPSAVFPIIRSLVEDLFLLKYVDIDPDYITKYMEIKDLIDKEKQLGFLKKKCLDKQMKKYYAYLCNNAHPNPVALKFYLYPEATPSGEIKEHGTSAILLTPFCNEFYLNTVKSLNKICSDELDIINRIYIRNK